MSDYATLDELTRDDIYEVFEYLDELRTYDNPMNSGAALSQMTGVRRGRDTAALFSAWSSTFGDEDIETRVDKGLLKIRAAQP